ncbi:hypothetical protein CUN64_08925 [Serratia sp. TKO39]|nr:hypothetical protein CUN64_08925 [Serratia sp. TKO39]
MPEKIGLICPTPRRARSDFGAPFPPRSASLNDSAFSFRQPLLCGKKLAMVRHYRLPSPGPRQYNDFRYH